MGKIYQVKVFGITGEIKMIDLCTTEEEMKSMTVLMLKKKISEKFPWGEDGPELRLVSSNNCLDEDSTLLSAYGIQHLSMIEIVRVARGGGDEALIPKTGDGGMGDKGGKNLSMENLSDFKTPSGSNFNPQ